MSKPKTMVKMVTDLSIKSLDDDTLYIEGYANTVDKDRHGDVVLASAWKKGVKDFKRNPIILAFHNHDRPVGVAEEIEPDENGLKIKARISKAAGDIYGLIKDGIIRAFSVGFIVKDADYDDKTNIFVIKALELLEVSVVSVPANASSLFSLSKSLDTEEFENLRARFVKEEKSMPEEIKDTGGTPDIDYAAIKAQVAEQVKRDLEEEAARKAAEEKRKAEEDSRIAVAATTAAERLLADFEKKMKEENSTLSKALEDLHKELAEKSSELEEAMKARNSRRNFGDSSDKSGDDSGLTVDEKDAYLLMGRIVKNTEVKLEDTKLHKSLLEKSGREHWDSGTLSGWEEDYSTRVYNAMREELVVERQFQTIQMSTPTLHIPINPEAGFAQWIPSGNYRSQIPNQNSPTQSSTGQNVDHELDDNTLVAHKLVAKEYIGYEEVEDSIVALMPIIRDAVARRMARGSNRAILRGAGANNASSLLHDPILGLTGLGLASNQLVGATYAGFEESHFIAARKSLGIYGIDPAGLVFMASYAAYYDMMGWDNFMTVDKIGIDRATLRTGQVGSLFGVPVVVVRDFDNDAIENNTSGTHIGVLVRPTNFLVGNLRNIMTETSRDIENQKNVIVTSRRMAFKSIINGQAAINFTIGTT